ncbi:hypothetical protein ANTQUA_LOCUS7096 [Anthophora quadrimaculata]
MYLVTPDSITLTTPHANLFRKIAQLHVDRSTQRVNPERPRIVLFPSLGTVHVTMMRSVTTSHVICMPFN